MARRLGPKPAESPAPAKVTPEQFISTRTKGLQLITQLQPATLDRIVKIDSPEGYLQMDAKLAAIKNVRAQWKLALEPISGPLDRAIQKMKEGLAEAKKAAEGAKHLDQEVSSQLDRMEYRVKGLMEDYKREERRQIEEKAQEKARAAQELKEKAKQKAIQAAAAKTPQMKARLQQQQSELEEQAFEVQVEDEATTPVKGASSVARVQQKVRIADPIAFLKAVTDYQPVSGVYTMGKPPLRTTDRKGEDAYLVEIVSARLTDLWREQPGVVASFPGVVIEDDIIIAGR